jgi:hypothetical protein
MTPHDKDGKIIEEFEALDAVIDVCFECKMNKENSRKALHKVFQQSKQDLLKDIADRLPKEKDERSVTGGKILDESGMLFRERRDNEKVIITNDENVGYNQALKEVQNLLKQYGNEKNI